MQKNFEKVIKDYPKSDFALDSEYKLELIEKFWQVKKCIWQDIILREKMDTCNQ